MTALKRDPSMVRVSPGVYRHATPQWNQQQAQQQAIQAVSQGQPMPRMNQMPPQMQPLPQQMAQMPQAMGQGIAGLQGMQQPQPPRSLYGPYGMHGGLQNFGFGDPNGGAIRPWQGQGPAPQPGSMAPLPRTY